MEKLSRIIIFIHLLATNWAPFLILVTLDCPKISKLSSSKILSPLFVFFPSKFFFLEFEIRIGWFLCDSSVWNSLQLWVFRVLRCSNRPLLGFICFLQTVIWEDRVGKVSWLLHLFMKIEKSNSKKLGTFSQPWSRGLSLIGDWIFWIS